MRSWVFAILDGGLAPNVSRGTNTDSVLALDKRIEEMKVELIQLKRSRNSLLSIARISTEALGYIFRLSVIPGAADGDFAGLRKDPSNLLLVSHHWSEIHHAPYHTAPPETSTLAIFCSATLRSVNGDLPVWNYNVDQRGTRNARINPGHPYRRPSRAEKVTRNPIRLYAIPSPDANAEKLRT